MSDVEKANEVLEDEKTVSIEEAIEKVDDGSSEDKPKRKKVKKEEVEDGIIMLCNVKLDGKTYNKGDKYNVSDSIKGFFKENNYIK